MQGEHRLVERQTLSQGQRLEVGEVTPVHIIFVSLEGSRTNGKRSSVSPEAVGGIHSRGHRSQTSHIMQTRSVIKSFEAKTINRRAQDKFFQTAVLKTILFNNFYRIADYSSLDTTGVKGTTAQCHH